MTTYREFNLRQTPQNEQLPGEVANSAGGYTFGLDKWGRLDRFLILGSEGGTYYIQEKELTKDNAKVVQECIEEDGPRTVARIAQISEAGRAIKNDPALFALALAISLGSQETKRAAAQALPRVARIGTHLFHFAQYASNMRGWGRILKQAIASWYDERQNLGYQLVKYQSRDGWSHADLIKLSHPNKQPNLYDWVLRGKPGHEETNIDPVMLGPTIMGFMNLMDHQEEYSDKQVAEKIVEYKLPREAVPTKFLKSPEVWEALLETDMPMEAMVRNLGVMSSVGLLKPMSDATKTVVNRLGDKERLLRSRIHPIKLLSAQLVYKAGRGFRGSNSWEVVSTVVDALNAAFYNSFGNVESTGKNTMLALDVSGSMSVPLSGIPYLSARGGSAAMALITANVEPNHMFVAFSNSKSGGKSRWHSFGERGDLETGISAVDISPKMRLEQVIEETDKYPMSGTDCALPMLYAAKHKLEVDTFIVYTDSETWAGKIKPFQALRDYRNEFGRKSKLVVVGMVSNGFTIADPSDPDMLDVVGFDTDTPSAISAFANS